MDFTESFHHLAPYFLAACAIVCAFCAGVRLGRSVYGAQPQPFLDADPEAHARLTADFRSALGERLN